MEATDVDLLAHEQFPQPAFGAGIDSLNVSEMYLRGGFHRFFRARMVSNKASTRAEIRAESDGE